MHVQGTLVIRCSLGPDKFACYFNKTLFHVYQGYLYNTVMHITLNNTVMHNKSAIRDPQNYLVIIKGCYISAHYYNKSPLYL